MTTEQELQSLLLRLSVLLATSLSTLSEPLPPTIIDPSSSTSSNSPDKLTAQILNDLNVLLTSVQKTCTNLTLALRPSKSSRTSEVQVVDSTYTPTTGLDSASLNAAKAQLTDLMNDFIPKLTWLSRKASSEAVVYRYVAKTADDLKMEQEERDLVKSKGGYVIQQPHSRETEKLEKIKRKGLGVVWSKAIVSVVVELLEALGDLSEAFMGERTLSILNKAAEARSRAMGGEQKSVETSKVQDVPKTKEEVRQRALQATGVVWAVCDAAMKGKLPKDNRIAVRRSWMARTGILQDALRELKEAVEESQDEEKGEDSDKEDFFTDLEDLSLSEEGKKKAAQYEPLLRAGCQIHSKAGEGCLGDQQENIDYDDLEEAGIELSGAVDDLVSSLLYSEEEEGEAIQSFKQAVERLCVAASSCSKEISTNLHPIQCKLDDLYANLM